MKPILKENKIMKNKFLTVLLVGIMAACLTGCQQTANEPCERCGNTPSVVYTFDNGTTLYVCEDCGRKCDYCDADATTPYLNGFGKVMFACQDCFESISR